MLRSLNRRFGSKLSDHDVQDVAQEVILSLWRKLPQFDGRRPFKAWAYGFCLTQIRKHLEQSSRRSVHLMGDDAFHVVDPSAQEHRKVFELEWVTELFDQLEEPQGEVVRLKQLENATFDEIGQKLGISTNTAKSHYYRCLARLRTRFERRQEDLEEG